MKKYLRKLVYGIFSLLVVLQAANALAEPGSNDWLVGTWELAFDPDGNPKDWLIFDERKQVVSRGPDGRTTSGTHRFTGDEVSLFFIVGSRSLQIPLAVSENGSRLTNASGAYYIKSTQR